MEPGQVLPKNVNLAEQRPFAVKSYIRRFRNIQTNSNGQSGQLAEIIIPIDTGTPGAFLDVAQSYLQFDLTITNPNPYIDYVDFPECGANALFEQLQIRSAGTPIETIRDYNTVFNQWMHIEGQAQEAFEMYMERQEGYDATFHYNNAKKPMVDWCGRIMATVNIPATYNSSSGVVTSQFSSANTSIVGPQLSSFGYSATGTPLNSATEYTYAHLNSSQAATGNWNATPSTAVLPAGSVGLYVTGSLPTTGGTNPGVQTFVPYPQGAWNAAGNTTANLLTNMPMKWGMLEQDLGTENINLWPLALEMNPNAQRVTKKTAARFQDYMTFLAHVKNIPVGCTSIVTSASGNRTQPFSTAGNSTPWVNGSFTLTVCVPTLSGILGVLAEKMAPTMLLDNFQLVMTTTNYSKALQVSMDPCRVIPGTYRDFLTYYGNELGCMMSAPGATTASGTGPYCGTNRFNTLLPAVYDFQWYGTPSLWNNLDIVVGGAGTHGNLTKTANGAPGLYLANPAVMNLANDNTNGWARLSSTQSFLLPYPLCGGETSNAGVCITGFGSFYSSNFTTAVPAGGAASLTFLMAGTFGSGNSYFAANTPVPQYYQTNFVSYGLPQCNYYGPPITTNVTLPVANGTAGIVTQNTAITYAGTISASQTGIYTIGNDAMACYGSFLPQSKAQTARCIQNYRQGNLTLTADSGSIILPKAFNGQGPSGNGSGPTQGMPYFSIQNICYVAQQVILPSEVTAQILQAAANGDISLQTYTIQTWSNITLANGSATQNIIIPAKVGSANTLYALFKHSDQTTAGTKQYLYNSLTGVCPLSYALYQDDGVSYYGTNISPSIGYVPATGTSNFSFQLKIGNDLVPAQPMQSATELLSELEKCTHGLNARYNNMSFNAPLITQPQTSLGALTNGVVYDCFADEGYFTTWCDPYYLPDQTVVNNLSWAFLIPESYANPNICSTSAAGIARDGWMPVRVGQYSIPAFKTPSSTFLIGFDLDTWSGMQGVAMCGRYLGNNPVSIACTGLNLVQYLNSQNNGSALSSTGGSISCTAFIMCDARWSIQAGGVSQLFI